MPKISLFGEQFKMLEYSMNIRSKIHDVITSNIANVNTPGYKCKSIDFEHELKKVIKQENPINLTTTDKKHFKINTNLKDNKIKPDINVCENTIYGNDKNNVDIDKEMVKLSENQLKYNFDSQILVKEFKILKNAIIEGGR